MTRQSSNWAAVDSSADPQRLVTGLDALRAEPFFVQSKERIAAVIAHAGATRVLDVGCGTGEDAAEFERAGRAAIGIENSKTMCTEARRRDPNLLLAAGDALGLPIATGSVNAVRADRVLQHLHDAPTALREWRRALAHDGILVSFDPDLTTATIDGVDPRTAATILDWRLGTRGGASTVHNLAGALRAAGFSDVHVETLTLDLADLGRADEMMGLPRWGDGAAGAGALPRPDARRWHDDVHAAARRGTLRYRCTYLLGTGRAGPPR
jgi:SAM-dependent methyltransferase